MSINQIIRDAILPIVPVCEPDEYDGDAQEYCVFAYDDSPEVFADGRPGAIRRIVRLDLYLPKGKNPINIKRMICRALSQAGFTYPYTTNLSDQVGQRYLFEFEYADGDV